MPLLLILHPLALPLNSCRTPPVLAYRSLHALPLTTYGVEQSRTRVRVVLVVFGYSGVVIEKVREVLSIRTVKF